MRWRWWLIHDNGEKGEKWKRKKGRKEGRTRCSYKKGTKQFNVFVYVVEWIYVLCACFCVCMCTLANLHPPTTEYGYACFSSIHVFSQPDITLFITSTPKWWVRLKWKSSKCGISEMHERDGSFVTYILVYIDAYVLCESLSVNFFKQSLCTPVTSFLCVDHITWLCERGSSWACKVAFVIQCMQKTSPHIWSVIKSAHLFCCYSPRKSWRRALGVIHWQNMLAGGLWIDCIPLMVVPNALLNGSRQSFQCRTAFTNDPDWWYVEIFIWLPLSNVNLSFQFVFKWIMTS